MPPKKAPPKTKKQLQEEAKRNGCNLTMLEKALEEQKRKEEQERKQKEEEERRRIEEERKRKELEEKLAAEEAKRLAEEATVYAEWDKDYDKSLEVLRKRIAKELEEAKRLEASPLPDPNNIKDLNAYLSLWADEKETSLKQCASNCQKAEKISQQIIEILAEAKCEEDQKRIEWSIEYLDKLRSLARKKINEITLYTLENIEKYLLKSEEERAAIASGKSNAKIEVPEKKDDDPNYMIEKLHKIIMDDITLGMYINRNNKHYKPLPIDFEDVRGRVEMPRNLSPANAPPEVMVRSVWTSFNDFSGEAFSSLLPVGGTVVFDFYKFGELFPVESKGWTVRQIYDMEKTLASIPYPDPKCQTVPSLQVVIRLPEYVFIDEKDTMKVALWDNKTKGWNTEGVEVTKFDKDTRNLELKTSKLAPMAYVVDRSVDYPYTSWYMRCTEPDKALLDLVTKRGLFTFEITQGMVKLIERTEPALSHIVGKGFAPGLLLHHLLQSGINLMPVNDDSQLCGYKPKMKAAEERAILELATSVNGFAFRSSVWNKSLSSEQVAMSVRLNLEYDREFFEKDEREWKTFVWYENKCGYTQLNDSDTECNPQLQDGAVNHIWFRETIKGMYAQEAIERCAHISQIGFFETVRKFLRLLRIMSFC